MKKTLPFIVILVLPITLGVSYYLYMNSGEQISEAIKQATVKPETTPEPTKTITDVVNPNKTQEESQPESLTFPGI